VSFGTFDVVIVVDWDIHEVATVEAEGSALFWFCEDIGPHHFYWAVYNFEVAVGNFVANEEVSAFDVFGLFGAREGAIDFKLHGRLVVLEENVLFDGVSLGLDKVSLWRIEDRAWSAPMSLDSVELLELILCLFEKLMAAPLSSDNIAPVWPW
jgi:hypothetical protein